LRVRRGRGERRREREGGKQDSTEQHVLYLGIFRKRLKTENTA